MSHIQVYYRLAVLCHNILLPAARQQYAQQWRFQQDNDPKHRSKVAKEFLNHEVPKIID